MDFSVLYILRKNRAWAKDSTTNQAVFAQPSYIPPPLSIYHAVSI